MTNQNTIEIDRHNGRPSVWLDVSGLRPTLHWLLMGQTTSFDVKLALRLSRREAQALLDHPDIDLDGFVGSLRSRRRASVTTEFLFQDEPVKITASGWHLDPEQPVSAQALKIMSKALIDTAAATRRVPEMRREAARWVAPKVSRIAFV